jgi:hypothetical protein
MKRTPGAIIAGCFALTLLLGLSVPGDSLEKEKSPIAPVQKEPTMQTSPTRQGSPPIIDGGRDVRDYRENPYAGIDLVVAKVEMERGFFMGAQKIRIIPTIKNMWIGRTSERIKITFKGLGMQEWIEGGIGPLQEIRAGAIYVDAPGIGTLRFSVKVDTDEPLENNEYNNLCPGITLGANERSKVHKCPVVGPHEPL